MIPTQALDGKYRHIVIKIASNMVLDWCFLGINGRTSLTDKIDNGFQGDIDGGSAALFKY